MKLTRDQARALAAYLLACRDCDESAAALAKRAELRALCYAMGIPLSSIHAAALAVLESIK